MKKEILKIGVTGSAGSGKSLVCQYFKKLGLVVSTGSGDGVYKLYVDIEKSDRGDVLKQIKIVFIE